tara:strand:- start:279 stop:644 length:366 start_codon:yes stop_codon:yes gene_type:complete
MSSYPDAFRLNCIGKLPTDSNYSVCQQKPIILENKNVVEKGHNRPESCSAFAAPQNVVQDNAVPSGLVSNKSWSNVRGYGNVVVATHDTENNMHGRVHPWNRLNNMASPYETPVVTKDAWN